MGHREDDDHSFGSAASNLFDCSPQWEMRSVHSPADVEAHTKNFHKILLQCPWVFLFCSIFFFF